MTKLLKYAVIFFSRWNKLIYASNILLVGCVEAAANLWDLHEKAPWLIWPLLFSMLLIVLTFLAQVLKDRWEEEKRKF